jgi:hypothetical protein
MVQIGLAAHGLCRKNTQGVTGGFRFGFKPTPLN